MPQPTIVFDFDGTVAVGDGPVLAYARFVAEAAGDGYLARVAARLADYERGESPFRDGYDVVGSLAGAAGVDAATLSAAYAHSRARLGTPDAPVEPAAGLHDLLAELDGDVRVVLATNAPADGIVDLLTAWGVVDRFDAAHFTVGKPAGLEPIVTAALAEGPVLSIGDIFRNDLAPAQRLGADTALVGATAAFSRETPTLRSTTLAQIAPDVLLWSRAARRATTPPLSDTISTISTER